jgi:hypothetical protein
VAELVSAADLVRPEVTALPKRVYSGLDSSTGLWQDYNTSRLTARSAGCLICDVVCGSMASKDPRIGAKAPGVQFMRESRSNDVIPAGFDLLRTVACRTVFNFAKFPLPAGLFASRSEALTKPVRFKGGSLPPSHFHGLDIRHVDTIVQRKAGVTLPAPSPRSERVPIELVALSLQSIEPLLIQVGRHVEQWDAEATISSVRPSIGSMIITKTHGNG